MTKLLVWPRLNLRSKRAMLRTKKKWGHPYEYYPRQQLLNRLSKELNMTKEEVLDQIDKEQAYFIRYGHYYR